MFRIGEQVRYGRLRVVVVGSARLGETTFLVWVRTRAGNILTVRGRDVATLERA